MNISFVCTHWGQETLPVECFFEKMVAAGYEGVEINLPDSVKFLCEFQIALERTRLRQPFYFIAQQTLSPATETVDEYIKRFTHRLNYLAVLQPDFINSHTGKDHFSFDENCRVIEAALNISSKSGVRILHETHRSRFSFHSAGTLPYLEKFPEMELVADLSHWCTVSESMLQDQPGLIEKVTPHIAHLHARVGYEHGPQVNDPRAPEWEAHLNRFVEWWKAILAYQEKRGSEKFTICPEFGPAPYMPATPYTQQPLSDQWTVNTLMKQYLSSRI